VPVITFATLADDPLGTASTFAGGINGLGQIVGFYTTPSPTIHGFLYTAGDYTTIDDPLGNTLGNFANGINGLGQIVGNYQITINGVSHGFLYNPYSSTPYTTLDDPLGTQGTFANGINGAGQIVGSYDDASGNTHGFLYNPNSSTPFTTIDDPLGSNFTVATGINASGQVVGYYTDANHHSHGFLYSGGTYTTLDDPAAGIKTFAEASTTQDRSSGSTRTPAATSMAFFTAVVPSSMLTTLWPAAQVPPF